MKPKASNSPRARPATKGTRTGNGAGQGDGWGGPARGVTCRGERAPPYEVGNIAAAGNHAQRNAEKAQALKDKLFALGMGAEREETQVAAARAWLDRHEGLPVAPTVNLNLSDGLPAKLEAARNRVRFGRQTNFMTTTSI